ATQRAGYADAAAATRACVADVRTGRGGAVFPVGPAVSRRWARLAVVGAGHALARALSLRRIADEGARSGRIVDPRTGGVARLWRAAVALMVVRLAGLALAFAARKARARAVGHDRPVPMGVARLYVVTEASARRTGKALAAALVGGRIAHEGARRRSGP